VDPEDALRELTEASCDDLGRLLVRASREVNQAAVARLHDEGFVDVRASHAAVLAYLDADGTRMSDIAQRSGLSRQAVATAIRELHAAGYVDVGPDPDDGRASTVRLAPRGVDLCRAAARAIREETQRWGAIIGDSGLNDLLTRLRSLVDSSRTRR
jgi:DNA-binding MarR family transcriptional regulator